MERMISDEEVIEIGAKLRELREKHHLSQKDFAAKLYWDASLYQKIESGQTLLTLDKARQLHYEYDVDLNYLIADDSYDDDAILERTIVNESRENSTRMIIRVLEYIIRILKENLRK